MSTEEDYNFEEEGTVAGREVTSWGDDILNDGHVPIGVTEIDEELGGLPSGSIVALVTDPRGVGDMFAYHLAASAPTQYITTVRPQGAIEEDFNQFGPTRGVPPYVDITDTERRTESDPKQVVQNEFRRGEGTDDGAKNFVIDTFSALVGRDNFTQTVRQLYTVASEKEGITYLIFTKTGDGFTSDEETAIHLCDAVFSVGIETPEGSNNINHTLRITKLRGNRNLPDDVKTLDVGDSVTLDRTRTG